MMSGRERKDVCVRRFRPADLSAVRHLIYTTINACYSSVYPVEAVKFFKDWHCDENILRGAKAGYMLVLVKDGRIMGTGTLLGDEIVRVFVDPTFQRRGFGKLIMQRLEERAISLGVETVRLHASLPSKIFYDSLEYQTLEEGFIPVENDERLDYYRMEKAPAKGRRRS
jgi:GNAT superfamily N-acetyltransferase